VSIPESADGQITVGSEGVAISQTGADASAAQRFGDENVFYGEVLPDTDLLVSPIAGGVELFDQLRSQASPETLRFDVEVPPGAELRPIGDWGAEVAVGEELLTRIPAPSAVDAQGTEVPVSLQVEGSSIVLEVAHRAADLAYPILLDPILENNENWIYGQNHWALDQGAWTYTNNVWWVLGSTYCIYECFGPSNTRGLYVSTRPAGYGPNEYGHWAYGAPNANSYITSVTLGPYWRNAHDCGSQAYPQPHDYFGVWGTNGWNYLSVGSANQPSSSYTLPYSGQAAIFGMSSGGSTFTIPCWRDLYAGGAHVWLDDSNWPYVSSVSGIPSGWFSDATQLAIGANTGDTGLGVRYVSITHEGKGVIAQDQVGCIGNKQSRCPTTRTSSFNLTGDSFGEGIRGADVVAEDPTGKTSGLYHFETKVDRVSPEVTLTGQLAVATNEVGKEEKAAGTGDELSLPTYNLKIEAKDGSLESNLTKRSGVKNIEIFLDGKTTPEPVPWTAQTCPNSSCAMTKTYQLKLNGLSAGEHWLEVKVKDQVDKVRLRKIEFEYFPATGMKDEYVLHYFPLPDGQGDEASEEHPDRPELAVNVATGNLVYREQDVEVDGPAVDLEVERYHNSMLPSSENSEWGDGWTLAQTPDLDPIKTQGSQVPNEAEILDSSGAIEDHVELPTAAGAQQFDPALQATLTKKAEGGYELTDETGESATSVAFDETGQTEALLTEGAAKVDYDYEAGELAEIAVEDPAAGDGDAPNAPDQWDPYGSFGTANGQLNRPIGLAADSKGNLWVADTFNHRIQKFGPNGEYLTQFGSLGSGNGQLNLPYGLTVDSAGNLWVADTFNHRVQKFGPNGEYLSQFGSAGSGNGQLNAPSRVAIDSAGNVWVADSDNHRIQKFAPNGAYLSQFGTKGTGNGQFNYPAAIAFDAAGNVWVADRGNHRIQKFAPNGAYLSQFGTLGPGEGQLNAPTALSIDAEGNLWVADSGNHRIQKLAPNGAYLAQFGQNGSGEGQFKTPYGMALDPAGNIWVADTFNNRIQVRRTPSQWTQFGSAGSGNGQLSLPLGLATDSKGNLWVADTANNRIQKFGPDGAYLTKFGSAGSANGQLNQPQSLALDSAGNLWVADTGNHRIQKFGPGGEYLSQFGTKGTANGQLSSPTRIAIDSKGNLWVADSGNNRIQKFNSSGAYLAQVGSAGSGNGQLNYPTGLVLDSVGNLWVADRGNHRIQKFGPNGEYLSQFGTKGSGDGQLNAPNAIARDLYGNFWVADSANNRVQAFTADGEYLARLGSKGSGKGQFNNPFGLALYGSVIWVADSSNHRLQRWRSAPFAAEAQAAVEDDPSVEVDVSAGNLVGSLAGEEAGQHTYTHAGDDLTAHTGPEGETKYQYDLAGRMTKVTLANGTYAEIAYNATYGRVASVKVDPAGADPAKTTYFEFSDEPRRTTVIPPDAPHVTYDIGEVGSVFKWWNALQPPLFDDLAGTLYDNREKPEPIWWGDHLLDIQAHSEEGIASIEVIANGNQLAHETTCEQDPAVAGIECKTVVSEWVTHTGDHPPGILNLEVLITDRIGQSASERFWVNIPEPPPPPAAGSPVPPKFAEIARFRKEFGLEVVFPVKDEIELNERILNLISAWWNGDPVARSTTERWGVPLRAADVAELEYREAYVAQAGIMIPNWASSHAPSIYAGYYVDHRAGGLIKVGFTQDQLANVAALESGANLMAPSRVDGFQLPPQRSFRELISLQHKVALNAASLPSFSQAPLDVPGNTLRVGTTGSVSSMAAALNSLLGTSTPVTAFFDSNPPKAMSRHRLSGPVRAGDRIYTPSGACTAGFGVGRDAGILRGGSIYDFFLLTAGHCGEVGELVTRMKDPNGEEGEEDILGRIRRTGIGASPQVDGAAIFLNQDGEVPRRIYVWGVHFHQLKALACRRPAWLFVPLAPRRTNQCVVPS
jgi:YD repeat-containing protein